MPKTISEEVEASAVRKGDLLFTSKREVIEVRTGPKNTSIYTHKKLGHEEPNRIFYGPSTDKVLRFKEVPTAMEDYVSALKYAETRLGEYDARVREARSFDAVTAFTKAATGREGKPWTLVSSFQVSDFLAAQGAAKVWAHLPTLDQLHVDDPNSERRVRGMGEPTPLAVTTLDRVKTLTQLHRDLVERYIDSSPSSSSSQVSNIMDEYEREALREIVRGAFGGGGLRWFGLQLERLLDLRDKLLKEDSEEILTLVPLTAADA